MIPLFRVLRGTTAAFAKAHSKLLHRRLTTTSIGLVEKTPFLTSHGILSGESVENPLPVENLNIPMKEKPLKPRKTRKKKDEVLPDEMKAIEGNELVKPHKTRKKKQADEMKTVNGQELAKPRRTRKKKEMGLTEDGKTLDVHKWTKPRKAGKKREEGAIIEGQEVIKKTRAKEEPLEVVLFPPSPEQKTIIDAISMGKSVIVDAVAGSGKTTTVLHIATQNPGKNIIQITYNKDLKREVREKVDSLKISNLEIQSYHSLGVRYYDYHCYTDDGIIDILKNNKRPRAYNTFDIFIIDETQDMTPNYFALVCKFIKDMKAKDATFLVLGDRYQGIYEFKDADLRFLVYFDRLLTDGKGGVENTFLHLSMQESFRATEQIAWFVNQAMLGDDRLISKKKSDHKVYYIRSKFNGHSTFSKLIETLIDKFGYEPSDFFILAPSLKGNSASNQLKRLENSLVEKKIPVHFARSDERSMNEKILAGKVVFSTFHQSKGRERKVAIVWGFDKSYSKYYNRDKDPAICPSELYVAATRASEVLIIQENANSGPLDFLKVDHTELKSSEMVKFIGKIIEKSEDDADADESDEITPQNGSIHTTSSAELTKYLSEATNTKLSDLLVNLFLEVTSATKEHTINIPSSVNTQDGNIEEVSDINGLVLPAIYEHQTKGYSTLQKNRDKMKETMDDSAKTLFESVEQAVKVDDDLERFLMMGNQYIALKEGVHSKFRQIDSYKWLKKEMVSVCLENLKRHVSGSASYERPLGDKPCEKSDELDELEEALNDLAKDSSEFVFRTKDEPKKERTNVFKFQSNRFGKVNIKSSVDCIDGETVWEFKCVDSFSTEHFLQLIVHAYIWEKCMQSEFGSKQFKILNIRTGEVKQLDYKSHVIEEIMDVLLENKYLKAVKDSDEEFIKKFTVVRELLWNSPINGNTVSNFERIE